MNVTRKQLYTEIRHSKNYTLNKLAGDIEELIIDSGNKLDNSDNEWYYRGLMTGFRIAKRIIQSEIKED